MKQNKEEFFRSGKGLSRKIVQEISDRKNEPGWMTDYRLNALGIFEKKPMPTWGADLSELLYHNIHYYVQAADKKYSSWDDVPTNMKDTFEKLGIPEAEQKALAGAGAQYESNVVYHNLKKQWEDLGVIFIDMDIAVKEHPELIKKYFICIFFLLIY